MNWFIILRLRILQSQHTWTYPSFRLTLICLGYHLALSRISGLFRKNHNYIYSLDSEIILMIYYLQSMAQNYYSNRRALDVLAAIRCTSWGNQERKRNFCCHVTSHQMTSIRWSNSHHKDAHCLQSLSRLSGPYYHRGDGSHLYPNRHGLRDIGVCMWSQVQSFPWWIWLEI